MAVSLLAVLAEPPSPGVGPEVVGGLAAVVALLIAGGGFVLARSRPTLWLRLLLWLPAHALYRIRVTGADRIPARGPVLLVCNHVSFLDAFLILLAQPRPVRFLLWVAFVRLRVVNPLLQLLRVIPLDGNGGARAIVTALNLAAGALRRGEAVCVFTESGLTADGTALPFARGLRYILKRSPAPVIPVSLDHQWGTLFSYHGGRFLWKWPEKLPYPVSVAFGAALPPAAGGFEVRQAIGMLAAAAAVERGATAWPVHRQFVRMACRRPFRMCVHDPGFDRHHRYGEALVGVIIFRRLLRPLLGDQPMVGVWLPPGVGAFYANLTLAVMRKTSVNLNYTSSPAVVDSAIKQCGLKTVITARAFTGRVKLDPGPDVRVIYIDDFRSQVSTVERVARFLQVLLLPGWVTDRWVLGLHRHRTSDLATVIFSSGTTGDPKGVMLSHANLVANADSAIQALDPRASDVLLGVLPFFHSFGYTVTFWLPLQVGASVVYHPDPRQAKEIGELCRTYRCTIVILTPTFLRFCLRRCGEDDFRTLRLLICGAEKLPTTLADEFHAKFGVRPLEGYGCTELSPVVSANVPDWELAGSRQIGNKPGSIGQPLPGIVARVVDPDTFEPRGVGDEGLLLIYGGNVMAGYLGREEATRAVIRDGWYVTGDIARIDEDGFITITDRLSRFSKIGGEMVPHQKIEDELHGVLGTTERVCVVTSVPDEKRGERLVVLYTGLNGKSLDQATDELGSRGLPNLWVPATRDFYHIPEVPVLGSGKVDLKRVKDLAQDLAR